MYSIFALLYFAHTRMREKDTGHLICKSMYIFAFVALVELWDMVLMTHEVINGQCPKILTNQFACRSQVSNYQSRNSDTLQIIRLCLGSQKRSTEYLMLLGRISLNYNSCFFLSPIPRNLIFAYLLKSVISHTTMRKNELFSRSCKLREN